MENPVLLKCDRTKRRGKDKRKAQVDSPELFAIILKLFENRISEA
jgi:hypothetical protein